MICIYFLFGNAFCSKKFQKTIFDQMAGKMVPDFTAIVESEGTIEDKIELFVHRYIDFVIPGLIALGIMNSAAWGLGYSLVEFRIKKLMRRMIATPLPRWIFLYSHFLTRYIFAFMESFSVAIFAYFVFDVQVTGSFTALLLLFSTGLWAFSGLSVLISSRTDSVIVANGLINATTLPMTLASGVFFSYQGFPDWIVKIIEVLPLTLLTDGLRQIYNEGAGVAEVADKCMILGVGGTVLFFIGLKIYKWY